MKCIHLQEQQAFRFFEMPHIVFFFFLFFSNFTHQVTTGYHTDAIIYNFFCLDNLCRVTPSEHGVPKINAPWLHPISHSTACNPTLYLLYYRPLYILLSFVSKTKNDSQNLSPKPQIQKSIQLNNDTKVRPSIHPSFFVTNHD